MMTTLVTKRVMVVMVVEVMVVVVVVVPRPAPPTSARQLLGVALVTDSRGLEGDERDAVRYVGCPDCLETPSCYTGCGVDTVLDTESVSVCSHLVTRHPPRNTRASSLIIQQVSFDVSKLNRLTNQIPGKGKRAGQMMDSRHPCASLSLLTDSSRDLMLAGGQPLRWRNLTVVFKTPFRALRPVIRVKDFCANHETLPLCADSLLFQVVLEGAGRGGRHGTAGVRVGGSGRPTPLGPRILNQGFGTSE
ncbi:hypothetical protein E2C01_001567 [Portunus trituberculatus]|uniref:Uncharacterized protein n=1 Tax=Portunus trituberculatus TaxID=210409 RepID=A0A5B7CHH8_PORTR|nr:hypothetical protein [Portunus trituberculatus]